MRGAKQRQGGFAVATSSEGRVLADHPLDAARGMIVVLGKLSDRRLMDGELLAYRQDVGGI